MADLTLLPHQLDDKNCVCRAIIETPKGCRNKFDYDPDSSLFILGGLLPEGMMFPFDFGFIPSTLGDDGDPLDTSPRTVQKHLEHIYQKIGVESRTAAAAKAYEIALIPSKQTVMFFLIVISSLTI